MNTDQNYESLIQTCLYGSEVVTRNSKCRRTFAFTTRFTSAPLVSVRKTAWRNALREWQWFMSGSNNINDLHQSVRHWWHPWADEHGLIANNYSEQFRDFRGTVGAFKSNGDSAVHHVAVDQIDYLIRGIENHPNSRRNVITTWNTAEMVHPSTPISNCHNSLTQAFVEPDNSLHLVTYQRSCDVICGVPANWIQEWAFLMWLASRTKRSVGSLTWIGGDCHVYEAHNEVAAKICEIPKRELKVPGLYYEPTSEEFDADDFYLDGEYRPVLTEKVEMVV